MKLLPLFALALLLVGASDPDAPKPKAEKPTTPFGDVVRSLPKGWTARTTGLPAGMLGSATGPDGEAIALSTLDAILDTATLTEDETRRWLLERLGADDGVVVELAPGVWLVRAALSPSTALRSWVLPGNPTKLLTWMGPASNALLAEKRMLAVVDRWSKR